MSDEPVGLDSDGLGFSAYARTLADAALGARGPLTMGVFGEWGTGKSSLMKMVIEHLSGEERIAPVWFNAWQYEREKHPIVPLIGTILATLETASSFRERISGVADDLEEALKRTAYGFAAAQDGGDEGGWADISPEKLGTAEKNRIEALVERSLYYRAYERLAEAQLPAGAKILVVIDDLDRCFPDRAIRLLEGIKLAFNQAGFVFLLGVARRVVEGYLEHRYREEFGIAEFSGQLYLDKIVQLPFYIPPHSGRVESFSEKLKVRAQLGDNAAFADLLPLLAAAAGNNPRATIRLVNNLIIDDSIASNLSDADEMQHVPLEFFAVSRALQQRWPSIYTLLGTAHELSAKAASWQREELPKLVESKDEDESKLAAAIRADRDLSALLLSPQGRKWLEDANLRTAASQFVRAQRREGSDASGERRARYDAFISYSAGDRAFASAIAEKLAEAGLSVFFGVEERLGKEWVRSVEEGIKSSRSLVFLWGQHSQNNRYQQEELNYAMISHRESGDHDFLIIPVLIGEEGAAGMEEMPLLLQPFQVLDLRSKPINRKSLTPLLRALEGPLRAA